MASGTEEKRKPLRDKEKNRRRQTEMAADAQEAATYRGIGEQLRARRLEVGLNLEDVVRELNIRLPHLIALEEGRFKDLPGRIYATGFLRNYAEHLGLDADAVLQTFKDETATPEDAPLVFPTPPPESRLPRSWVMLVALIIAVGVYSAWYYANHRDRLYAPRTATPPTTQTVPKASVPAPAAASHAAAPAAAPSAPTAASGAAPATAAGTASNASAHPAAPASAPTKTQPAPAETTAPASPAGDGTAKPETAATPAAKTSATASAASPAPASPSAAPTAAPAAASSDASSNAPSAAPSAATSAPTATATATGASASASPATLAGATHTPQVYGSTSPDATVVIKALSDAWITVSDRNHKVIFPGHILLPGDTYRVPPKATGAVLWTGNLGGLQITVNGKTLPRVGAIGQSERNIPLDPKQLIAFVDKKHH